MSHPDRLLSPDQVAAVLAVSRATVYRYIREGGLRAVRMQRVLGALPPSKRGSRGKNYPVRIPLDALMHFLSACGDRDACLRLSNFL